MHSKILPGTVFDSWERLQCWRSQASTFQQICKSTPFLKHNFLLGKRILVFTPVILRFPSMPFTRLVSHTEKMYLSEDTGLLRFALTKTQWFLTIDEYGNINGTQDPTNCYSILEIRTVSEGGVLAIKGVKSQYYISMNKTGVLQGKKTYNENCNFKEVFLENYFNAYSSAKWTKQNGKEMFIALSQRGRPLKGRKTKKESVSSHFIPMKCKEEERRVD
ncbi:hypothetical protein AGOR_G00165470 [Albula goreensis]|uniref:Fibroblast growth factor n=1 Tax=Albula goreensis TaxID=1534307 RepID=A0A8T3D130_9TELE|nr:hypothetical protein AGOR_G00165470 [Albula goreensis]